MHLWSRMKLAALCLTVTCPFIAGAAEHQHGSVGNHDDHLAALALVEVAQASHAAVASGDWADPATWAPGVPTAGARVVIPRQVTVTIRSPVAAALQWVRVEGRLAFSPQHDTKLEATTVVVAPGGALSIGEPDHRVDPDRTAQLLFPPRTDGERRSDGLDLSGGLIAMGSVQMHGAHKTGYAIPANRLERGASTLVFQAPPLAWKVGDELLFPAVDSKQDDERRRISEISDGGKTIELSSPLKFSHAAPPGARAGVPVGNLTRNIVVASTDTGELHRRGHVMLMTHRDVSISGASFRGLGRTTASRAHTLRSTSDDGRPTMGENPIGRYAVHFHLVSGASRQIPAQRFTGSVIVDSPKFGLVNHGGHVVAEGNVTYAIHGSHFFAENGSEIGAFRHNLAVFSRGSGDAIVAREQGVVDFGHGGHGFWSQSPAVVMEDNYAFHHAGPAYAIFAGGIEAAGAFQLLHFRGRGSIANVPRENLEPPLRDRVKGRAVPPTMVPARFTRNVAANSVRGLEMWNTNMHAAHDLQSVVEDSVFWNVGSAGIVLIYAMNTVIRNSVLIGSDPIGCAGPGCEGSIGITTEGRTANLVVENVHVARFSSGMRLPMRGVTSVSASHFDNKFNFLIYPTQQPGRKTILDGNTFGPSRNGGADYHFQDSQWFQGDVSMLFEHAPLIVKDRRFPGLTVFHKSQHPSAVPFRKSGIAEFDGKTAREIRAEYGLAIFGALAPHDAKEVPGVGGLVGAVANDTAEMLDQQRMLARMADLRGGSFGEASYTADRDEGVGFDCCNVRRAVKGNDGERTGWRLTTQIKDGRASTKLTYVDTTPPQRFELDPRIKLEIHPNDVQFGIMIEGKLYDEGESATVVRKLYQDLRIDGDGYVNVPFEYADRAGNVLRQTIRLKATSSAPRRGANLYYYMQASRGHGVQ